jgi:hypothetical protein
MEVSRKGVILLAGTNFWYIRLAFIPQPLLY